MNLGVCYYPEHWPSERWEDDAQQMVAAGLSIVRIGEFAWSQMEPTEGQFKWDWLDQAIAVLGTAGLQVVLGTPTATPPAWLVHAYPEVLPVDREGRRRHFGSRRHYCANSPDYLRHTRRIVSALAERYGQNPHVIGWQIDNEFGCHDTARCYCENCASAFRRWLEARYGATETLNEAWGNAFWSQIYTDWAQVQPPNLTVTEPNPSHVLDYWRFSSDSVVGYQQAQIDLLRERIAPEQFITTNFMGNFPDLDYHAVAKELDFVTWDSYPSGYAEMEQADALYLPGELRFDFVPDLGDPYVTGFCHDLTRGLKQKPFWVMEQQVGNVNWSAHNSGIQPGAVRLWTWHALAAGADAVIYFRWRAVRFAQEQHHSGLLHHDGDLSIGYRDVKAMQDERETMDRISAAPYQAPVALLLDYQDLWALQIQPHRKDFGYLRHLFVFYRALAHLGIQVDLVPPDAPIHQYRLVIGPTSFLANTGLASSLETYVGAGGSVLLGVRSGFKTRTNLVTACELPGPFRRLVGAKVADWHALLPQAAYPISSEITGLDGLAGFWAEALTPDEQTQSLARYTGGPFAGQAALTAHRTGQGQALYLGFYPSLAQAEALLAYLAGACSIPVQPMPAGVLAIRRGPDSVLLNFTEQVQQIEWDGKKAEVGSRDLRILS